MLFALLRKMTHLIDVILLSMSLYSCTFAKCHLILEEKKQSLHRNLLGITLMHCREY